MASLIGPVTPSPAERELAHDYYRDARKALHDARRRWETAEAYASDGKNDIATEWRELAVATLTWAVWCRGRARHMLRMFSGLSADWVDPWA